MFAKELAELHSVSTQFIRAETKKASDKNELYVNIGGVKYSYCLKAQGRGRPAYFYEKQEIKIVKRQIDTPNINIELDEKQKEKLNKKLKIVTGFADFKKKGQGGVKEYVKHVKKFIDTTYTEKKHYDWQRDYKNHGARGLIDKRGKEKGTTKLTLQQQRFLIRNFRAFGAGEINYAQLWEELHREEEKINGFDFMAWKQNKVKNLCDRGVVQRFITNYYDKRVIEWTLITKGEDLNKSYNQPAMGSRKEQFTAKNQCWEIDSTPADVIIYHEGKQMRPDILAIIDCFTGRCVAVLSENSNKLAIIRLLWRAISEFGMPKMIKGDNGRDYLSKQFQNLLDNLHIKYDKAIAYSGDQKGQIERKFRTIQHSYMRLLVGFIGHNVSHRQKIEQQIAKKDRKAKDEFGNVAKTQAAKSSELLSWHELNAKLQEAIFLWEIDKKRRKGPSPIDLWNNCLETVVKIDYENFLVYAGGYVERTVQKDGINYDGRSYRNLNIVNKYRGQKVYVSENIDNMSEVFVFDKTGVLIGVCEDRNISTMTKEDFVKAKREFAKDVSALQKEIKQDKLSARSKTSIKDDLKRARKEHDDSLKPVLTKKISNDEIQEKSKKEIPKFDDREIVKVVSVKKEVEESPYSAYAIAY